MNTGAWDPAEVGDAPAVNESLVRGDEDRPHYRGDAV